ncbi:putative quinone oxidoreductase [Leucoagaricus sp. SymC.cos]|nr:putative quinone oxidoreductase [Leucoagaricus sp. SymC.cos]
MPPYRSNLPSWLSNAYTESHINLVLQTLAERESRRKNFRPEFPLSDFSLGNPAQPCLDHYSVAVASRRENLPHNRYSDVVPYDRTRVIVRSGVAAGRYINASWILERFGHKWWIATQAPLPSTAHRFLSLISQQLPRPLRTLSTPAVDQLEAAANSHATTRIRTVVQLTKNVERGRTKAHPYFPTEVGKSLIVPPDAELSTPALKVTLLRTQDHEDAQCIQSTVAITPMEDDHAKAVIFQHLMYTAWPDHGVPEDEDRTSLLVFLKLVDTVNKDLSLCEYPPAAQAAQPSQYNPDPPIIVGCSVEYGGVNFIDTYFRRSGLYPLKKFPAIIGKETAGTILALPTDPDVLNHPTYKKNNFVLGGRVASDFNGSHATYISVPWKFVYPLPDDVSTKEGAAALLQGLTAATFFEEAYKVKKGDTILVHTIAGGLGLLFAQLGRHVGATVIGTTSTVEKAKLAKEYGADHVILYTQEDTVSRVLELTNGDGVDAIFDGVGKTTFDSDFKMIKRKGTIVSVGNASGPVEPFSLLRLVEKNVKLLRPTMSNYVYTPEEAYHYGQKVGKLLGEKALKIHIFKEYPFTAEGVQQAQRDLTGGKTVGKLLIKIAD